MSIKTEKTLYQKLLELEKLKSTATNQLLEFRANNKNYYDLEDQITYQQHLRLEDKQSSAFKDWENFKNDLEKKYSFKFPVSCYCSDTDKLLFAEFFKTRFSLGGENL